MDHAVTEPSLIHYIPIVTTVFSAIFCGVLLNRYRIKGTGTHLLWWAVGIFCYGVGTALEASITLWGNSAVLNKAWYIAGAIFGGYPLAQGTVYLLMKRRTANILSAISLPVILVVSVLAILSPTNYEHLVSHKPGGAALAWMGVRLSAGVINTYAGVFLIGGACFSAWIYKEDRSTGHLMTGNILIAIGALLPAIGGSMAAAGIVEGLYVGEFLGLLLIWAGYGYCVRWRKSNRVVATASQSREFIAGAVQPAACVETVKTSTR